jgi:predicted permease
MRCLARLSRTAIEDSFRDARHGARLLRKSPGFSAVVISTLALAIGATVTVFSIVDAWLVRPLAFPQSEQLVVGFYSTRERPTEPAVFVLYRDYLRWKERSRSFDGLAAAFPRAYLLQTGREAATANGLVVTADFFDVLGTAPRLGRLPLPQEAAGASRVVLSYGFWQRQFGGSPSVLGTTIVLNGVSHEIAAVMPPDFEVRLLEQSRGFELWTFFQSDEPGYGPDGTGGVAVFGRLHQAVSIASAQSELLGIHAEGESRYPQGAASYGVLITSMQGDNTRTVRTTLVTVGGAVMCLLLAACMNVATLMLGRGFGRVREASVRAAIGAGRGRLLRQFLAESVLLSVVGGVSGVALAMVATRAFVAWNPLGSLPAHPIAIDPRAIAFAVAVTAVTVVICGLAPALRMAATDPGEVLRAGGDRGTSASAQRGQALLLVVQIAFSVVLLVATSLLTRSFLQLRSEPLGFNPASVTVASLALPADQFKSGAERNRFYGRLAERLVALPGVNRVAVSTSPLLASGPPVSVRTGVDDRDVPMRLRSQDVSTNYFEAMEIPLLSGRRFDQRDVPTAPLVAAVNESAARALFGSVDAAVGRLVQIGGDSHKIVGIVGDTRSAFFNTLEWTNDSIIYLPAPQAFAAVRNPTIRHFEMHVHIRSAHAPAMAELKAAVASVDAGVAVTRVLTASDAIADATKQPAFRMSLLAWFGATTLLLAAIGVYGLVSQNLALRRREIGIRLALGAAPLRIVAGITRHALLLGGAGVMCGCAAAIALTNIMRGVVYGVRTTDTVSFLSSVAVLLAVTGFAALLPALRARRIDPITVLRSE